MQNGIMGIPVFFLFFEKLKLFLFYSIFEENNLKVLNPESNHHWRTTYLALQGEVVDLQNFVLIYSNHFLLSISAKDA
jgi:hypothetical protein